MYQLAGIGSKKARLLTVGPVCQVLHQQCVLKSPVKLRSTDQHDLLPMGRISEAVLSRFSLRSKVQTFRVVKLNNTSIALGLNCGPIHLLPCCF